jgi:hypothetical protein
MARQAACGSSSGAGNKASRSMTERYCHLAPGITQDAVQVLDRTGRA